MNTTPAFGFNELFTFVVGDIAKAICGRNGETPEQQFARSQAAVHMIMGFLPRDVVEALLAGHCVMLHETMLASVRDILRDELESTRRGMRSNLVVLNKEFNVNLGLLADYQKRPAEGRRDAPEVRPDAARTENTARTVPPAAEASSAQKPAVPGTQKPTTDTQDNPDQTRPDGMRSAAAREELDSLVAHVPGATIIYHPSPAVIAECRANPEAMAALEAGDPERFAKALGIAVPSEAFLEAANSPGSPFDPNAAGPWPADAVSAARKT